MDCFVLWYFCSISVEKKKGEGRSNVCDRYLHDCGHRRRDKGLGDIVLSGIMAIGKLFRRQETSGSLRRLCDTPPAFLIIIASLVFET